MRTLLFFPIRHGNHNAIASAQQRYPDYQASFVKGENRVRFENLPPSPPPVLQTPHCQNLRFDHTFPKIGVTQTCKPQRQHQQRLPEEIERELYHKTNLVREQQRQLEELQSRMVIPVLPESYSTSITAYSPNDSTNGHPVSNNHCYNDASTGRQSFSERGEDVRVKRLDRARRAGSASRYHSNRRGQSSLNRNNNNNNSSYGRR